MRGGEKVLLSLARLYPEAPIYTLLHVKGSVAPELEAREIRTSFVQRLPMASTYYRQYLPLFPMAIEQFDLDAYDLVISSSHCAAKAVVATRIVRSGLEPIPDGILSVADDAEPPFISTLQLLTVSAIPPLSGVLQSRLGAVAPAGLGRWVWFVPMLTVTAWLVARMARRDPRMLRLLLLAYALPVALLSAVSAIVAPVLIPRVLLPVVVPVVVLVGSGVEYLSRRRVLNHAVLGALTALLLLATLCFHRWAIKEEWREASRYLGQQVGREHLVLLDVDGRWVPPYLLRRYDTERRLANNTMLMIGRVVAECPGDVGTCLDRAFEPYRSSAIVWTVHSHTEFMPRHAEVERWLAKRLEPLDTREFEGIQVNKARIKGE